MPSIEKISVALPPEMVTLVKAAVHAGEYASSSEVIREALRDWTQKRSRRDSELEELRSVWQQAIANDDPGTEPDEVFARLERKYQAMVIAKRP
jgi:antitoxin ParD1/3/4